MLVRFSDLSLDVLFTFSPLLLALMIAALCLALPAECLHLSPKAAAEIRPDEPARGLQRLFSWSGLVDLVKAVAKAGLLGGMAAWVIWSERDDLLGLLAQPVETGLASAGHLVAFSFSPWSAS